jgi:hypothetical protein
MFCVADMRCSRVSAGQDPEPGRNAKPVVQTDAMRPELPENEIYAMNQKVGNQNALI